MVVVMNFWTFSNILSFLSKERVKYYRRELDHERYLCTVKVLQRAQFTSSDSMDIERRSDRRSGITGNEIH